MWNGLQGESETSVKFTTVIPFIFLSRLDYALIYTERYTHGNTKTHTHTHMHTYWWFLATPPPHISLVVTINCTAPVTVGGLCKVDVNGRCWLCVCSDCANGKMKGVVKKMCFPSYLLFHQLACAVLCAFLLCVFVRLKSKSVFMVHKLTRGRGRSSLWDRQVLPCIWDTPDVHAVARYPEGLQLISNIVNTIRTYTNTLGILD